MRIFPHWSSYALLSGVALFDLVALWSTNISIETSEIIGSFALWSLLIGLALLGASIKVSIPIVSVVLSRIVALLLGLAFLSVAWDCIRVMDHLSMRLTADIPYVDGLLGAFKGLWLAYFHMVQSSPWAIATLQHSYTSLSFLSLVCYCLVCMSRDERRVRFYLEAFFISACVCTAMGALFPARGAVMSFIGPDASFVNFSSAPGMWFNAPLAALRTGDPITLHLARLPGLVSFPSFHTAAAVVIAASLRGTYLSFPAVTYAVVVIAATPIFGGHYFADIAGGGILAFATIAFLRNRKRYRGLFADSPSAAAPQDFGSMPFRAR